jgi:hypothetical protein
MVEAAEHHNQFLPKDIFHHKKNVPEDEDVRGNP